MKSLAKGRKFRFPLFIVNSMMVLPLGCAIALLWANLGPESYYTFAHAMEFPVNEVGIVFFFGLMTKQVVEAALPGGELHPWRRAALPVIAAFGGIVVPALLYYGWLSHVEEPMLMQAWAVTCAIDVAACYFVGGIIFGKHPAMPFLLLLSIASNVIGLIVLATVHAAPRGNIIGGAVVLASALVISFAMRRGGAKSFWPYLIVGGGLSWLGCWMLGVHPALALVPIVPFMPHGKKDEGLFPDASKSQDALSRFDRFWTPPVQVLLFLFGLVNAGVKLHGVEPGWEALPIAVILGRPIGVMAGAAIGRATGFHMTERVGWRELLVIGCAASMGLTLALFFSTAIFPIGVLQLQLKCGALGTAAGAVVAFLAALALRVGRFKEEFLNMRPTNSILAFVLAAAVAVPVLAERQRGVTSTPAGPVEVLIIRHGEEPNSGPHLNDQGRARANALINFFKDPLSRPTSLFAAKSSPQSARSVETITPLSKALGLGIDVRFTDQEYKKLASSILHSARHDGGHVLICWHHETMTELAAALGVANPPKWPSSQYDHVWRIRYEKGKKVILTDELQNLSLGGKDQ